jgi:hypothetical protein
MRDPPYVFHSRYIAPGRGQDGDVWEAYLPAKEGYPLCDKLPGFPRKRFMPMIGLVTITLMIENIIGLDISLPRKTVNWTMPSLEAMGIEGLSLKRNLITILSNKECSRMGNPYSNRRKLYYFTIEILDEQKRRRSRFLQESVPCSSTSCDVPVWVGSVKSSEELSGSCSGTYSA